MREVRARLEPNPFASPYVMDSSAICPMGWGAWPTRIAAE